MGKFENMSNDEFCSFLTVYQIYEGRTPEQYKADENELRVESFRRKCNKQFETTVAEARKAHGIPPETVSAYGFELQQDKGRVANTIENYAEILRHDEAYAGLRYNTLSSAPYMGDHKFTDADESRICCEIERKYGIYSRDKIARALQLIFAERHYNPVRDMIDAIVWDGKSRIYTMLTRWLKCEDTDYTRECSRLIFAGGIHRIYNPGCKFDDVVVLIGTKQGEGKSSFVRWLAMKDEYFAEVTQIEGKEGAESVEGVWIAEFGELLALTRVKEQNAVKSYITRTSDHYRKPFEHYATDVPRQCIFIGTTNQEEFITDKTGGRRFYPVSVKSSGYDLHDHKAEIAAEIAQCWAEAKHLYDEGKLQPMANRELIAEFRKAQDEASEEDYRIADIREYLSKKPVGEYVCIKQLWSVALGFADDRPIPFSESRTIGLIMQSMPGWKRAGSHRIAGYGAPKTWVKVSNE